MPPSSLNAIMADVAPVASACLLVTLVTMAGCVVVHRRHHVIRRSLAKARTEAARLAEVINRSTEAVIICDRGGAEIYANDAARRLEEQIGHPVRPEVEAIPPLRPAAQRHNDESGATDATLPERDEIRLTAEDGKTVHLVRSTVRITDPTENVECVALLMLDFTKERQIEDQRRRLVEILESSPNFVAMTNANREIEYLSRGARELCGLPPGDPEKLGFDIPAGLERPRDWLYSDKAWNLIANEAIPTVEKTGIWQGETEILAADGQTVPVMQIVMEHSCPSDQVRYYSTIISDISSWKRMEQRLVDAQVAERCANTAKSGFLAAMSHEIRTPLNAIVGFSDMLRLEVFGPIGNERYTDYVNDIFAAGQHLLSLIDDVLDLSKIEAGKLTLEIERIDLVDCARRSIMYVKERAARHRLDLNFTAECDEAACLADSRSVRQVMLNLLSNAVKYTPEGGRIDVCVRLSPMGLPSFSVTDTGIGIPENELEEIFSAFNRSAKVTRMPIQGAGLGLAITRQLIETQGGTLVVESKENAGSTFSFTLPAAGIVAEPIELAAVAE